MNDRIAPIIIYALDLSQSLPYKEKYLLLQRISKRSKLLIRLVSLMFNNKIIKTQLVMHKDKVKITNKLNNADKRLTTFISLHEKFYDNKIKLKAFKTELNKMLSKLTLKEKNFYYKLMEGNKFYLDYEELKIHLFNKKDFVKVYARFCSGFSYQENWNFSFPVYLQHHVEGLQVKVIATPDKINVISRGQKSYKGRFKLLEEEVLKYLVDRKLSKIEVDVIISAPNKLSLASSIASGEGLSFTLYDVIVNSNQKAEPLYRRIRRVKFIAKRLRKKGHKNFSAMEGSLVPSEVRLKSAIRSSLGAYKKFFIKEANSVYTKTRTEAWVKLNGVNTFNVIIKDFSMKENFHKEKVIDKLFGTTTNGYYISVNLLESHREYLKTRLHELIGKPIMVTSVNDDVQFSRILYEKIYM